MCARLPSKVSIKAAANDYFHYHFICQILSVEILFIKYQEIVKNVISQSPSKHIQCA